MANKNKRWLESFFSLPFWSWAPVWMGAFTVDWVLYVQLDALLWQQEQQYHLFEAWTLLANVA